MNDAYEAARAAWPDIALPLALFEAYVGERACSAAQVHASDLYLACACVNGLPGALAAFERVFMAQVPAFLARMRPSPEFCDEVAQGLRTRMLLGEPGRPPRLAEYSGRGALAGWLRVAALRLAIDLRRSPAERAHDPLTSSDQPIETAHPELEYLKSRYRSHFAQAFRAAMAILTSEQRNLMRLHLVDGVTLEEMGGLYGVNRSTIFRRLATAQQQILAEARRVLGEELGLTDAEFDSLANLVRSQLDLSLPGLLRTHD